MKTTLTVQSIHDGTKITLTFNSDSAKQSWIQNNAHNYVLIRGSIKK